MLQLTNAVKKTAGIYAMPAQPKQLTTSLRPLPAGSQDSPGGSAGFGMPCERPAESSRYLRVRQVLVGVVQKSNENHEP